VVIDLVVPIPDALRHLRNFAKKRHKLDLLKSINDYVNRKKPDEILQTGIQQFEFSEIVEIIKENY
jgi:hypothetical protein